METNNNIRPSSLGAVAGGQNFGSDIKKRAGALRGLTSSGAQTNNTDNFMVLPINNLKAFREHPFNIRDDSELVELSESIKVNGILHPIIVRSLGDGTYEILAGHRRVAASEKAGIQDIPAKVLNVSDDEAIIIMTDTNLRQREKILHSERAKAYKMQMEAYRKQGKRHDLIQLIREHTDLCSIRTQVELDEQNDLCSIRTQVKSRDIVANMNNTSALQITRYLRLNELIDSLLELVDTEEIPFTAGVALSFLNEDEQQMVANAMEEGIIKKMDLKSAEELKIISKQGNVNETVIKQMYSKSETAKPQNSYVTVQSATKKVLKHFKKVDYADIEIKSDELEAILIETIQKYAENLRSEKGVT